MMYKKILVIPVIFFLSNIGVFASDAQSVETIVVSATRSEQSIVSIPTSITVITKADILNSGLEHISDVLRLQAGVQISDSFGDGSRAQIGMRGFTGEIANANTLVLVDGRRLNNPDIGGPDLNSIALKDVERIEIVQGSAAVLFGDQAVGGVINVITSKPQGFNVDVALLSGSFSRQDLTGQVSDRFDNGLSYRLSVQTRESDNYRDHNKTEYDNALFRGDYNYGSGSIFLELQDIDDEQLTPGALFLDEVEADRKQSLLDFENDFSLLETSISRIGLSQTLSDNWSLLTEYTKRDAEGEFILSFRGLPLTDVSLQKRDVTTFNPRLIGKYTTARGEVILTVGYDQEESDYTLASILGTQANNQETNSVYAQAVLPLNQKTVLTLGLRNAEIKNALVDRPVSGDSVPDDADLDDDLTVYQVGLVVKASQYLRHFIRYEENFRFAKVDEHTSSTIVPNFFTRQSDDGLDTQTGESFEIGIEWSKDKSSAKLVIYRVKLDNEIAFDPDPFVSANINLDSTRREGVIMEGVHQINDKVRFGINYTYINAEVESGLFEGNEVPFIGDTVVNAFVDYKINSNWHMNLQLNRMDDRVFSGDFTNSFDKLEGYETVNLQIDYRTGNLKIAAHVNNLLDEEYSDFGVIGFNPDTFENEQSFFPSPERYYWISASYQFD